MFSMTMAWVVLVLVVATFAGSLAWVLRELWFVAGGPAAGGQRENGTHGTYGTKATHGTAPRRLVFSNETATATGGGAGASAAQPPASVPAAGRRDVGSGEPAASRPPEASARAFESAVLCNLESAAADGWYPVAPFGDHPHPRGMQCLTADDAQGVVSWANAQGADWTGVPVHANPAHPQDGPALAWVKKFRVMANELQCLPEWSPEGHLQIVVNKAYKRVTPSWTCEQGSDSKWHPVDMVHIGLTNVPNIKATRPWVNAETAAATADASGGRGSSLPRTPTGTQAAADTAGSPGAAGAPAASPLPAAVDASTHGETALVVSNTATADNGGAGAATASPASSTVPAVARQDGESEGPAASRPPEAAFPALLQRLANSLAVAAEGEAIAVAVDGLANRALRLERELGDVRGELAAEREFANSAVVDLYIARRRVDPAKRDAALAICAAGRDVALAAWDNAAVAAPRRNMLGATPPADPLAGAVLSNTAGAAGRPAQPGGADLERIVAAGKRLQTERGLDPSAANREAWAMYQNGSLQTAGMGE